jgi:hypothetical protein
MSDNKRKSSSVQSLSTGIIAPLISLRFIKFIIIIKTFLTQRSQRFSQRSLRISRRSRRFKQTCRKNFSQISQIYADAYSSALLRENLCAPLREKYSAHQSREKNFSQISQIHTALRPSAKTSAPLCEKNTLHTNEKNFSQISQIYADTFTISPMCSMWFNFH